jgi:hypothetical protein
MRLMVKMMVKTGLISALNIREFTQPKLRYLYDLSSEFEQRSQRRGVPRRLFR